MRRGLLAVLIAGAVLVPDARAQLPLLPTQPPAASPTERCVGNGTDFHCDTTAGPVRCARGAHSFGATQYYWCTAPAGAGAGHVYSGEQTYRDRREETIWVAAGPASLECTFVEDTPLYGDGEPAGPTQRWVECPPLPRIGLPAI